jgi:glycosyltransferase involved in cell wall biosynthesis
MRRPLLNGARLSRRSQRLGYEISSSAGSLQGMRVAIDTRSLRPPLAGIGHFTHRLTEAMLPLLSRDETLLAFNGWALELLDRQFLNRIAAANSGNGAMSSQRAARQAGRKLYNALRPVAAVRKGVRAVQAHRFRRHEQRFDVFHAINYVPPGKSRGPVLPFIHDLSHIRHPKMHPRDRVEWLQEQLAHVADAPLVQTNSQFSKGEITAVLGIPAERIYVTYAAPGADFRRAPDGDEVWLAKNALTARRFILAVGTREPRKNFKSVAEAYVGLPENLRAQIPLVWCGPAGWGDLSLSPSAARAKGAGQIRIAGYVPDRELAALYRNCTLFVMASVYEGFGMPVVEAMACGARIALSRIPIFEEIAGDYARYVEPLDVEEWGRAIREAVEEARDSSGLQLRQPDLVRFSWQSSAAATLDLYRQLRRLAWGVS